MKNVQGRSGALVVVGLASAALTALLIAYVGLQTVVAVLVGFGLGTFAGAGLVVAAVCWMIGGMDEDAEEPATVMTVEYREDRRGTAKASPLTIADLY